MEATTVLYVRLCAVLPRTGLLGTIVLPGWIRVVLPPAGCFCVAMAVCTGSIVSARFVSSVGF